VLGRAELDQPEPVGADRHTEHEEQHEAGDAQAARDQRRRDPERQQTAGDQDERAVVHWRAA
jgi:hypothetical protein